MGFVMNDGTLVMAEDWAEPHVFDAVEVTFDSGSVRTCTKPQILGGSFTIRDGRTIRMDRTGRIVSKA